MDHEQIKDLNQVEGAPLSRDMKLIATTTVSSLHYLKALSFRLGISIEDITADQIISECSQADVERVICGDATTCGCSEVPNDTAQCN